MPFVAGQLQRHPRAAARGRVLRLPQGRVHRRQRRPRGLLPGGAAAARSSSTRSATCRCRCSRKLLRAIQERSVRPVGAVTEAPVDVRAAQRDAQGPGRRSPGRPVPPGPLLPPQRDPDPRAAAARAPRGPDGDQRARCSSGSRATPASRRRRALTRDALRPPLALSVPGQRARAREPAASRAWRSPAARSSTSTTSACRSRCSPTARRRSSTAPCRQPRRAAERRPLARSRRSRSRCPTTWQATSTTSSATSWSARSSTIASTAPRPASAWACRCARCAIGWRASNVNVGGDAAGAEPRVKRAQAAPRSAAGVAAAAGCGGAAARRRTSGRGPEATAVDLVVLHSISLPPGEYGGDAIERLFTNRLDWDAHPYFETHPRSAGLGALPDPPRRRAAAVRVVRRPRLARRRVELARPRRLQRLLDRHRARRARGRDLRSRRSTSASARLLRAPGAALSDRMRWPATSMSRRGARTTPARASTGRACAGSRAFAALAFAA